MFRRLQVQSKDLGRLALKVCVIRDHAGDQTLVTTTVIALDALHRTERYVFQLGCQFASAPVSRPDTRLEFEGAIKHLDFELGDGSNGCASRVV